MQGEVTLLAHYDRPPFSGRPSLAGIADMAGPAACPAQSRLTQGRHSSATLPLRCGVLDKARTTPCPEALGEA